MNKSSTASASSSTEDTQDLPLLVLAIGQGTPELENGGLAFFNVDTTDQAIEMLDRRDPDIILIHAHELGEDTLHWVALLHQHAQRVPIVLAVKDDQDYLIGEAMRRGAADYVPLEELPDTVTYYHIETEDHDVILIADEREDFGRYVLYNTWKPRPVAGSEGLTPRAWSPVVEQWGAAQLQSRFQEQAGDFQTLRALDLFTARTCSTTGNDNRSTRPTPGRNSCEHPPKKRI